MTKALISVELYDGRGRVKEEIEGVCLSRELIRKLRDTEFRYSGYITLYLDKNTHRVYFNDQQENLIHALNNLLESVEEESYA